MEIKEIEGKKFIEYDEYKYRKKRFIMSILFLILLSGAIVALLNATFVLLDNKDIIQQDPLIYGMGLHNFTSCQCFDSQGKDWYSTEKGFIHEEQGKNWINYSSPEYTLNISNFGVEKNRTG